jgi:hypothetical protein
MQNIKSSLISLIIPVSIFLAISIAYMSPALSGKNINQHDITQHKGQSKELVDYREKNRWRSYLDQQYVWGDAWLYDFDEI